MSLRTVLEKISCGPHQRELSNVFMTVGDADTPRHPRFLRAVTIEFRRVTEDCATVGWSHGIRHGDVLSGEPREPGLQFSSRLRLVHTVVYPGMSCLRRGWDSDISAKNRRMFCKCYLGPF